MSWVYLIIAGLMEVGFTFCLGKTKTAAGVAQLWWWGGICFFDEPASFRRIFFITTLILSIIGLKML